MPQVDIRPIKKKMRGEIKAWRQSIPLGRKALMDEAICARVRALREYRHAGTIVTYVSTEIEVDTQRLIRYALAEGKRVAVPRCVEGTRNMEFFYIRSLDDLEDSNFGLLEPVPERCEKLEDFTDSICLSPALAYDRGGFRLGYGGGYYDRFLSGYAHPTIGLIYARNLRKRLWRGRYDIPVDIVVSESGLLRCGDGKA